MSEVVVTTNALPKNWRWSTLEKIAAISAGNPAPQGNDKFADGLMPFVRVQDMGRLNGQAKLQQVNDYVNDEGANGLKLFKKGSVLFTKSGASTLLNQRAILDQDSYIVSHIAVAEPKEEATSEWIYYWMKQVDFGNLVHGSNMPSLPLSKIKNIPVPIAPPAQQKRIVERIEKLFTHIDAGIAALKTAQQLLMQYRQSVLKAAFTGQFTQCPNASAGETIAKSNGLPKGWRWSTFGQIAELLRGVNYKKPDASAEMEKDKVPILRAHNIGQGLNFEKLVYVPKYLVKDQQFIKKGDIIIAMSSGSKHLVGKAAQANEDYNAGFGAFCANLRITPNPAINPKYVAYYYATSENLKRISNISSGSNINNLKREHILSAPIPIAPAKQQKIIAAHLEKRFQKCDRLAQSINIQLTKAEKSKQSILAAAFSGNFNHE